MMQALERLEGEFAVDAPDARSQALLEFAETLQAGQSDAVLLHAGEFYRKALGANLAGLAKLKVEKRLEELSAVEKRRQLAQAERTLGPSSASGELWSDAAP